MTGTGITVLAGLLFAVVSEQSSFAQEAAVPRDEPLDECSSFEMPESVEFDCGNAVVPEFRDRRSDNTVSPSVVRLRSTSEQPREPIFFGSGGPGGSAFTLLDVSVLSDQDGYCAQLLANHDLIFFSQRGAAYSDPFLSCFAVNDIADKYLAGDYQGWSDLEEEELERLKSCCDDFVSAGMNFAAFNNLENAADINSIREPFDYDRVIYSGESHGTPPGQRLMREFPETLSALVLDVALDACAHSIILQFFIDPTAEPESSCPNDRGGFEFVLA